MDEATFKRRTKQLGLDVIRLVAQMPRDTASQVIGRQIVRSATSVGANYRAACKARSKLEFISKLGTVEEEADESVFWLELIIEGNLLNENQVRPLLIEAGELVAIAAASRKTASGTRSQIANRNS